MNRSDFMMFGVICGIIVGLLVSVVIVKFFNKDGKFKTQYDEMQEIKRGRGFKYGFYTVMAYEALLAVLSIGSFNLPVSGLTLHFIAIFLGIMVLESYCIFNDAFIGLNTNGHRYAIVCVIISIVNFAVFFSSVLEKNDLYDGIVNFLCGFMFIIIGVEILIKKAIDKNSEKEA